MSQPTTIALTVDTENSGVTSTLNYSHFESFANRSVYNSEHHDLIMRDTLGLYRTFPKPTDTFRGVGRSAIKFTSDISVPGRDGTSSIVSPLIVEISFSVPVGATEAQIIDLRQRAIALLDSDEIMTPLNLNLMV